MKKLILAVALLGASFAAVSAPPVITGVPTNGVYAFKAYGQALVLYKNGKMIERCVSDDVNRGIFPDITDCTATGHFKNGDSSDGIVYYADDFPETWFSYATGGDIVYDGIYCTGKLIDKTHFKRDTLRNNNENVGNVALVTGKNSRIIDLNRLDWYCIHNRTTSYNECIFCGDIENGDYYCRDAMLMATNELDNSEDDDKNTIVQTVPVKNLPSNNTEDASFIL